jgi:hypothetical protein
MFPHQNPVYTSAAPIRAICLFHLILLDFMTRKILGDQYRSLSSSLCNLLHSLITSSLLSPNVLYYRITQITVFQNVSKSLTSSLFLELEL